MSDAMLRRHVEKGELRRLYRGSYAASATFEHLERSARHATTIRAALAAQHSPPVVSHQSAAVLYGLPLWNIDLRRVQLTEDRQGSGRRTAHLHVHQVPPGTIPTRVVGSEVVTTPARTLFDVAATVGFEEAVVIVDAALHANVVSRAELDAELALNVGRHGRRRAALVFAFADGRSESVGESRSRVGFHRAGLLMPSLQYEARRPDGRLVGRCDFCWKDVRLLGEFDGLCKYGRLLKEGEEPGDAVAKEKRREDALRELEFAVVRWLWSELGTPALYRRIAEAIERARRVHGSFS